MPNNYAFNYNPEEMKTLIYGNSAGGPVPVNVDAAGNVSVAGTVAISGTVTVAGTVNIGGHATTAGSLSSSAVTGTVLYWPAKNATAQLDISQYNWVTFALNNTGTDAVSFWIELSADGSTTDDAHWSKDTATLAVTANNTETLATRSYLKYARMAYVSTSTGATVNAWYQAQV